MLSSITIAYVFATQNSKSEEVFSEEERSSFVSSSIFILQVFWMFSLSLHIVYKSNLGISVSDHFFIENIEKKSEKSKTENIYLGKSKVYKRTIIYASLIVVPIISIIAYFLYKNDSNFMMRTIGNSGIKFIMLNLSFIIFFFYYDKMIGKFNQDYKGKSIVLLILYWIIIPIPYCVGFVSWSPFLEKTGTGNKSYYQSLMIYFGIVLIISTTVIAIFSNLYLFEVDSKTKEKSIVYDLQRYLSRYYVFCSLTILKIWLVHYKKIMSGPGEEEDNDEEKPKVEAEKEREVKGMILEGNPMFWLGYTGKHIDEYKKEIITQETFDQILVDMDEDDEFRKKYPKKKPGWLQKIFCCAWGEKKKVDYLHKDFFDPKIKKEIRKYKLKKMKKDQLTLPFKETVKHEEGRRNRLMKDAVKVLYHEAYECIDIKHFKDKVHKRSYKSKKYPFKGRGKITKSLRFGKNLEKDPESMMEAYFNIRVHPYFSILKQSKEERDFFLLQMFNASASSTTMPDIGAPLSMSYYNFNRICEKISLWEHILVKDVSYNLD